MKKIKRTIIKADFNRERFFPLSGIIPVELFSLAGRSIIQLLVAEAISIDSEEIVILSDKKEKLIEEFFKDLKTQEKELKKKGNPKAKKLANLRNKYEKLEISFEKELSKAIGKVGNFAFLSSNQLIDYDKNSLKQLMNVFKTSERPVLGLREVEMGEIETEKIAKGLFKIKGFTDESSFELVGRGIFTGESRKFFKDKKSLKEAMKKMIERGHTIYGSLIKGNYFKIKNESDYLKAELYYAHKFGNEEIADYISENL